MFYAKRFCYIFSVLVLTLSLFGCESSSSSEDDLSDIFDIFEETFTPTHISDNATLNGISAPDGDAKYYTFTPTTTGTYTITLTNLSADYDLSLALYNSSNRYIDQISIASSFNSNFNDESIVRHLSSLATYVLEVYCFDGSGTCDLTITGP